MTEATNPIKKQRGRGALVPYRKGTAAEKMYLRNTGEARIRIRERMDAQVDLLRACLRWALNKINELEQEKQP